MPDIKIYVSRRINLKSIVVDNPLYIPVRCGAVFDTDDKSPYIGDDTGENITEKRDSYCEFTVQYWAWKNVNADYYGLCHYRRYLCFSKRRFRAGAHGLVLCPLLDIGAMRRYGLLDEVAVRDAITKYDLVIPEGAPVSKMPLPKGRAGTVRKMWEAHEGIFFDRHTVDRLFELINRIAPEYRDSARNYFSGGEHFGYNCYVMRRELFSRLCGLQFPVMEAIERELPTDVSKKYPRTVAYVGEMLFGVFIYHVMTKEHWRVSSRQLVLFEETEPSAGALERFRCYLVHYLDRIVWSITLRLFPLGSRRREVCKRLYRRITRHK